MMASSVTTKAIHMTPNTGYLSRLMRVSWDIQKRNNKTRSKALTEAWAIFSNEAIAVHYLARKLNHGKPLPERARN